MQDTEYFIQLTDEEASAIQGGCDAIRVACVPLPTEQATQRTDAAPECRPTPCLPNRFCTLI